MAEKIHRSASRVKPETTERPGSEAAPFSKVRVGKRLESLLSGRNLHEVAEKIGTTYESLRRYIRGKRHPTVEVLAETVKLTGCRCEWLVFGEEPMFPTAAHRAAEASAEYRTLSPGVLAVVGRAAADDTAGALVELEAPEGWHRLPAGCAAVEVVGTSLAPIAFPGQKVLVDTRDRSARDGDLVILETTDAHIYAKRFSDLDGKRGEVLLTSVNPVDWTPPIRVPWSKVKQVRVIVGVLFE